VHHRMGSRVTTVRRIGIVSVQNDRGLGIENLHPAVVAVAGGLFVQGFYADAIRNAVVALELRVQRQSKLGETSGVTLMKQAFEGDPPPIDLSWESGISGKNEQQGLQLVFMGLMKAIRNPKSHRLVEQDDPQRALEYLGMVSVLFRRLDDAEGKVAQRRTTSCTD
jgi:uncharacterized protein (TIGR02391 family)